MTMQTMKTYKFNLNDIVIGKKTGLPGIGIVTSISTSQYIIDTCNTTTNGRWSKLYPDWQTKLVYTIEFRKPQRHVSLDEYKEGYEEFKSNNLDAKELTPEQLEESYLINVKFYKYAMYPEDDLELFENENN